MSTSSSSSIPSQSDARTGVRLATAQADRLLRASATIADEGDYGIATSLCILAGEEAVKAVALAAWAESMPLPTEDHLRLLLRGHEARYVAAGVAFGVVDVIGAGIAAVFAAVGGLAKEGHSQLPEAQQRRKADWSRAAWWATAGDRKNRGLYVGFAGGRWIDPADVDEQDYREAFELVSQAVELAKGMVAEAGG